MMDWSPRGVCPDDLGIAIALALKPVKKFETEWDEQKLYSCLRNSCKTAAKNLAANVWRDALAEYADRVFTSVFQALGTKEWVTLLDLIPVLEAAVKELLPPSRCISEVEFQRCLLEEHDRARDEKRVAPLLWEALVVALDDEIARKVFSALETGRKVAVLAKNNFMSRWIEVFFANLSNTDSPKRLVPEWQAKYLFQVLTERGTVPAQCETPSVAVIQAIVGRVWNMETVCVRDPSDKHGVAEDVPCRKRQKSNRPTGTPLCVQQEDCVGDPSCDLFWHVEDGRPRDIYCSACLAVFRRADPTLEAVACPPSVRARVSVRCTQKDDCVGTAACKLFQHVENGTLGDVYCSACLDLFRRVDSGLIVVPWQSP